MQISLGRTGRGVQPSRFVTRSVKVSDGDSLLLRPQNWDDLTEHSVEVIQAGVEGKEVKRLLRSRDKSASPHKVKVRAAAGAKGEMSLTIETGFGRLDSLATAVIAFLVTYRKELVGQHVISVSGEELHRGRKRVDSWTFVAQQPGEYDFTGYITTFSGTAPIARHTALDTAHFSVLPVKSRSRT